MNSLVTQWVDTHGAASALVIGGLLMGFVFGWAAQQSRFCARASIIDAYERRLTDRSAVWLLAFAVVIFRRRLHQLIECSGCCAASS